MTMRNKITNVSSGSLKEKSPKKIIEGKKTISWSQQSISSTRKKKYEIKLIIR